MVQNGQFNFVVCNIIYARTAENKQGNGRKQTSPPAATTRCCHLGEVNVKTHIILSVIPVNTASDIHHCSVAPSILCTGQSAPIGYITLLNLFERSMSRSAFLLSWRKFSHHSSCALYLFNSQRHNDLRTICCHPSVRLSVCLSVCKTRAPYSGG